MIIASNEEEFIEKFSNVVGLYRTYSILDLIIIQSVEDNKKLAKSIDTPVLFSVLGQETMIEVFRGDLHTMRRVGKAIEKLDFN